MDNTDHNHHGWGHLLFGLLKFACTICACQLVDAGLLAGRAFLIKVLENILATGSGKADWVFNVIHPILDGFMLLLFLVFFIIEIATVIGMVHFAVLDVCAKIRKEHRKYKATKLLEEKKEQIVYDNKEENTANKPMALEIVK